MTLGHSASQAKESQKSALAQLIQSETVSSSKVNLAITDTRESHEEGTSEIPVESLSESHEISAPIEPVTSFEEQTASETAPAEAKPKNGEEPKHGAEESAEAGAANAEDGAASAASSSGFNFKNLLSALARNFYKLKYLALVLAFLINFLMLFYKARAIGGDESMSTDILEAEEGGEEEELIEIIMMDPDEYYIEYFIKVLAFIHSLVAFAMMVAYYVLKVPLVIFKREKEVARKLEFEGLWIAEQPSEDDLRSHWDKLVISTQTYPEMYWDKFVKKKVKNKYAEQFDFDQLCKLLGINAKSDEYKVDDGNKGKVSKPPESTGFFAKFKSIDWNYQIWKWGVIFSDNSFLYVFWYFCFSVIGNFNYFFFACHLVDVAVSIKSLTTILKSITHNGKQLLLTMMLMAIVVYMYTVIAFNFFRKFYASEEDGEVEQNCHDLFTCFKFHLYIGIRSGGGIGDELESPVGDSMEFYRIIFDITFFFFIIVILLAIIQGLIIDAFGELRDQLNAVAETLEAACFICGIGKDYFDKVPHGFEIHTMKEHNFANYMFFLMHIINKPDTEHTGQETYVWQMYNQRCWDFFPAGDCFRKQYEGDSEQ